MLSPYLRLGTSFELDMRYLLAMGSAQAIALLSTQEGTAVA